MERKLWENDRGKEFLWVEVLSLKRGYRKRSMDSSSPCKRPGPLGRGEREEKRGTVLKKCKRSDESPTSANRVGSGGLRGRGADEGERKCHLDGFDSLLGKRTDNL